MVKNFWRVSVVLVCFLTCAVCPAQEAKKKKADTEKNWTAQETRLIDRPDEIVAVLENGMVAIVRENHTSPVAAVRLYVRAGSIYEQDRLGAGLSHLFEHLLHGGATKKRSEDQSRMLVQEIGAKSNAYTTKDHTCYYLTVPAQHVGVALELIADWVTRPTFPKDAFDREWDVVQRELEMGATDPRRQIWKLFDELRYKIHPGRYPVIGHQTIVKQLDRKDILAYYHKMYVPDNCVIVICGDISAVEMLKAVKKEFADFTRCAKINIVMPSEPAVTAPREIVKVSKALRGPAKMMMGFPSFDLQNDDLYALDTLANILGEGKSSRLYQSLRENKQLVLSVSAYNYTPHWADGTFTIVSEQDPVNVSAVRKAIWQEINKIKNEQVNPDELARAKKQLQVAHIRSHQTAEDQASAMARDYLSTGDAHFSDHYVDNMQTVTAKQVQTAANKYLDAQKQMTLVLTPKPLPISADAKKQKSTETPIRKITLDNGLRVLIKRNAAVPLVNMQFFVMGGLLDETDKNNGLTNLMSQLSVKGTVGGVIHGRCGNNTYFCVSEVMSDDFAKAFDIFSEVILEPTFPDEELAKLKPVTLAGIDKIKNSWPAEGSRFFRKSFFADSPYRRLSIGTKESVSAITRDQLVQYYKTTTVGSRSVLAVFGDINLDEVEQVVRKKFVGLPKGQAFDLTRFAAEPAQQKDRFLIEKTDKNGATVHIGFAGMKLTDIKDRYPMKVLMEIVGSNSGWLHELLRGKGLVYYAWGYNAPFLLPGYVVATAQCEAEKAPEVVRLIKEQLAKAAAGKFTKAELARARSNLINSEVLTKLTSADAAMTAALDELYYLNCNWSKGNADRYMAVTIADVQRVAQKYLSGPMTITVKSSKPELFNKPAPKTGGGAPADKAKPTKKK